MQMLKDDEVGCYTCARDRTGDRHCKSCIRWSNWQGVKEVNEILERLGLPPYIDATEMRIDNLYGTEHAIAYRIRKLRKIRKHLEQEGGVTHDRRQDNP